MDTFFCFLFVLLLTPSLSSPSSVEFVWEDIQSGTQESSSDFGEFRRSQARAQSDPLYADSWHLHSTPDSRLGHINVEQVWQAFHLNGSGIRIGHSFQAPFNTHKDLVGRQNPEVNAASPEATATAILATAVGNGFNDVCTRGVAYGASFSTIQPGSQAAIDLKFLLNDNDAPDIFLLTFTAAEGGKIHRFCKKCWENVESAVSRGIPVVSYAGNGRDGDNCNYDMYSNHPFSICVGFHTSEGIPSEYSEPCANVIVSAPGGDTSKGIPVSFSDGIECSERVGGQYAASMTAGVVALMKQANPTLTPRDISHILVLTSSFPIGVEYKINGAGLKYNEKIGFGNLNAYKAVQMAAGKINRPYLINPEQSPRSSIFREKLIPEKGKLTVLYEISAEDTILVDYVTVFADIQHPQPAHLSITLISPSGTKSELAKSRELPESVDLTFENWGFSTTKHWLERAAGTWSLVIADDFETASGLLRSPTLTLHTFSMSSSQILLPTPTPTPTPTPFSENSALNQCCYYTAELGESKKDICFPINEGCHDLLGYRLLFPSLFITDEECYDLCNHNEPSPTPTPSPVPTPLFPSPLQLKFVGLKNDETLSRITWSYNITSGSFSNPQSTEERFYVDLAFCNHLAIQEYKISISNNGFLEQYSSSQETFYAIRWEGIIDSVVSVSITGPDVNQMKRARTWYSSTVGPFQGIDPDLVYGPGCTTPSPTPTPNPDRCCWYIREDETLAKKCLTLTIECPLLSGFTLFTEFIPQQENDCSSFCD